MTNKEKYKQAFSALHPSGDISVEVERMAIMSRKAKFRTAAAAAAACLLVVLGGGMAYAADVGGIQRTIQLWVNGEMTNAEFQFDGEGSYVISYPKEDGSVEQIGGGGVAFDEDGNERPLTESEILEEINMPDVVYEDDGTVWVYYYGQKIEITDRFEDGVCFVEVSKDGEILYMTVRYQGGYGISPHKYLDPESFY